MRTIKRYPNRKLYDLEAKQYITLADVAALVQHGEIFQVVEHLTAQDVTTLILTQVVLERAKTQHETFSNALLRSLIQAQGDVQAFFARALGLGGAPDGLGISPEQAHPDAVAHQAWQRLEEQLEELERKIDRLLGK